MLDQKKHDILDVYIAKSWSALFYCARVARKFLVFAWYQLSDLKGNVVRTGKNLAAGVIPQLFPQL